MQYTTITLDHIHPDLRDLVSKFLLKCKYPYILGGVGGVSFLKNDPTGFPYYAYIAFVDPNNPDGEMAGALRYAMVGGYGNRRVVFRIVSRKAQTDKHRYDGERRRSKETKDAKKVLNLMLKLIVPFTPQDITEEFSKVADREVTNWRREHYMEGYRPFENLNVGMLVEEIKHLVSLGVEFKTETFKSLVTKAIPTYDEYKRRGRVEPKCYFVNIKEGKGIDVTERNSDTFFEHYNKFEDMPTLLQEGVSLLKMLGDDEAMIPIGYKVGANKFWVFEGMESV